jgi:hypothetical protein
LLIKSQTLEKKLIYPTILELNVISLVCAKSLTFNSISKPTLFGNLFCASGGGDARTRGANSLELPGAKGALSKSPGHLSSPRTNRSAHLRKTAPRGFYFCAQKSEKEIPGGQSKIPQRTKNVWRRFVYMGTRTSKAV